MHTRPVSLEDPTWLRIHVCGSSSYSGLVYFVKMGSCVGMSGGPVRRICWLRAVPSLLLEPPRGLSGPSLPAPLPLLPHPVSQLFSWVLGSPELCVPAPTFSLIYVIR